MSDFYATLGVPPNAASAEIKDRYRFLAHAYHPDKFSSDAHKRDADEAFKKINEAFQTLSNPSLRADYDRQRASGPASQPKSSPPPPRPAPESPPKQQPPQPTPPRSREWSPSPLVSAFLIITGAIGFAALLVRLSAPPTTTPPKPWEKAPTFDQTKAIPTEGSKPLLSRTTEGGFVALQEDIDAESQSATKERPFVNSLGMKFVPVPGTKVSFCIWETRVQDYEAFAQAAGHEWPTPTFQTGPTHPAANVNWDDAVAFCEWLSKKERRAYRLPTDAEWSVAVGLRVENGSTPGEKSGKASGYPWGKAWPPPWGAGNYFSGLNMDNFGVTAPVGSFAPNAYGIFDLGGNVWEWCEDCISGKKTFPVLRGGSWCSFVEINLRSSYRNYAHPATRNGDNGFRCVLVVPSG